MEEDKQSKGHSRGRKELWPRQEAYLMRKKKGNRERKRKERKKKEIEKEKGNRERKKGKNLVASCACTDPKP